MSLDMELIKRRLSHVPPPPWGEFCESGDWWIQPKDEEGGPREGTGSICGSNASDMEQTVADFIVAAPSDIKALLEEVERLRKALEKIAAWELPETGETWEDGKPVSYGTLWGSNGERDFIRGVARDALS